MLVGGGCSIYEHRPRTCRSYDCRVFPAAGVVPDDKPLIAERSARWRFEHPGPDDGDRHAAVRAAAAYLRARGADLPGDLRPPSSPTGLAVAAVDAHRAFLGRDGDPTPDEVAVAIRASATA
jgi:hypothetical protein